MAKTLRIVPAVRLAGVEMLMPVQEEKFMHVLFDCGIADAVHMVTLGEIVQNVFTDATNEIVGISYKDMDETSHHFLAEWLAG